MSRVNLIAWDNGFGLTRNLRLLAAALAAAGHQVSITAIRRGKLRKILRVWHLRAQLVWQRLCGTGTQCYDVSLMLEHVRPEYFPIARHNVLMPHPEWFLDSDHAALEGIDHVFALTRHALPIFARLGKNVRHVGFTSEDRLDRETVRAREFFHLAGRSQNKGTEALLALWRQHPQWPLLTVVQSPRTARVAPPTANIHHRVDYLSDTELRHLQNEHRFHLCPSETEGFGHYLVEALSVGAVTLTVDAPPMNEMVTPERGVLVAAASTGTQNLAVTNFFAAAAMTAAIERMIALDDAELESIGRAARAWFEDNDRAFRERIDIAVRSLD